MSICWKCLISETRENFQAFSRASRSLFHLITTESVRNRKIKERKATHEKF